MQIGVYPRDLSNIILNRLEKQPKLRLNSCKNFLVFFKELLPCLPLFIAFF